MRNLNIIDAVVTEDSDLLVYGCNVIYKLDEEGMCQYLDLS
jgi:5'-3' exonuclease